MTNRYHTARFHLAKVLTLPTLLCAGRGAVWAEPPRPVETGGELFGHVRIGYARASTTRQSLDSQLDALSETDVTRVFSEKISTRATWRPELEAAVR